MKISRSKLQRIVKEEMARSKKKNLNKTVRIREGNVRKMIREEIRGMYECGMDPYSMPGDEMGGEHMPGAPMGGQAAVVDKHGSLSNPAQKGLEPPLGAEFHHPAPGMEWEGAEDEDDMLLGMEY